MVLLMSISVASVFVFALTLSAHEYVPAEEEPKVNAPVPEQKSEWERRYEESDYLAHVKAWEHDDNVAGEAIAWNAWKH